MKISAGSLWSRKNYCTSSSQHNKPYLGHVAANPVSPALFQWSYVQPSQPHELLSHLRRFICAPLSFSTSCRSPIPLIAVKPSSPLHEGGELRINVSASCLLLVCISLLRKSLVVSNLRYSHVATSLQCGRSPQEQNMFTRSCQTRHQVNKAGSSTRACQRNLVGSRFG